MSDTMTLRTTDGVFEKLYDKKLVVLDASNRNTNTSTDINNYTIPLSFPLRDVVAITPVHVQLVGTGYIANTDVYLDVNQYPHMLIDSYINSASSSDKIDSVSAFLRIPITSTTGASFTYNISPTNLGIDPYTYVFDPVQGSIRKFEIRLLNKDGSLFDVSALGSENLLITMAVYMKREKFSRL